MLKQHARQGFDPAAAWDRWGEVIERLRFEQESFGALHQMLAGLSDDDRADAWAEIEQALGRFERRGGFEAPCELIVAAGTR